MSRDLNHAHLRDSLSSSQD